MKRPISRLFFLFLFMSCAVVAAFAVGMEVGHRRGYDLGWRECKFDAKEQMASPENEAFWRWHGSKSVIRQHRSFWFF